MTEESSALNWQSKENVPHKQRSFMLRVLLSNTDDTCSEGHYYTGDYRNSSL